MTTTEIDNISPPVQAWRPEDTGKPTPERPSVGRIFRPDIMAVIEQRIAELDTDLRALSLDIHGEAEHPEIGYEERRTHDVLTDFMAQQGFEVERHYLLPSQTAWKATFRHGHGGRIIGVNSEMDALKGIGHGCGHNLIAIAGVAVACAMKAAFEKFNISGAIELLGTPAEEGGDGKIHLLERGAYKNMAACIMCHPAPGPKGSVSLSSCLALHRIQVQYFGHTAHAALSPWEGVNALDAAVLGYNNISALRQQLKPTHRVHGIFHEGRDWQTNVIPDFAEFVCYVRAPTRAEVQSTLKRVLPCFKGAAMASGCTIKIEDCGATHDLRQNKTLGDEVANIVLSKYGSVDYEWGIKSASTDFGNVSYELPSLHPGFAIPTEENGGNHTPGFTRAAATIEAHYACLDVSKALAATGVRVVIDDSFFKRVQNAFEEDKIFRDMIA